jgi:hypothetical protein
MTTDPADGIMFFKHNSADDDLVTRAVAAEREACAKIAEEHCTSDLVALVCGFIAAAIRARGETPTKAPGEIDWSAMDKD